MKNQNKLLTQLLDSEKVKAERMRDDLIKQVSSLLVGFTEARDASVREAVGAVRDDIEEGQKEMAQYAARVEGKVSEGVGQVQKMSSKVESRAGEGKKVRDEGLKVREATVTITSPR